MKKLLAAILAVCTVLSMMIIPTAATGVDSIPADNPIGYSDTFDALSTSGKTIVDLKDITENDMKTAPKKNSENYMYVISNKAGFENFAKWSSTHNEYSYQTFAGVVVYLSKDIDMEGATIASLFPRMGFQGKFDGRGHTIKNLTVTSGTYATAAAQSNDQKFCGLFSYVTGNNSLIVNLKVDNCTINNTVANGGGGVGGLVGGVFAGSKVSNCYVNATVKSDVAVRGVGGIAGATNSAGGVIEKCTFAGTVDSNLNKVGGIIGQPYHNLTISNCVNNGNVKGNYAGGIAGYFNQNATLKIQNCINNGDVRGIRTSANNYGYAAGILGYNTSYAATIENCKNYGYLYVTYGSQGDADYIQNNYKNGIVNLSENLNADKADYITGAWIYGYQTSATYTVGEKSVQDIRIIGVINSLDYQAVGFNIVVNDGTNDVQTIENKTCQYVYTSIIAGSELGAVTSEIESVFPGGYFFALTIKGVPVSSDKDLTFDVTAFAKNLDTGAVENGENASFTVARKN